MKTLNINNIKTIINTNLFEIKFASLDCRDLALIKLAKIGKKMDDDIVGLNIDLSPNASIDLREIDMENLQYINFFNNNPEFLYFNGDELKSLRQVKFGNLASKTNMKNSSDFSKLSKLENLMINKNSVPNGLENLDNLICLSLCNFSKLPEISSSSKLKRISLTKCDCKHLDLEENFPELISIHMDRCKNVNTQDLKFPRKIEFFENFTGKRNEDWSNLQNYTSLKYLNLSYSSDVKFVSNLFNLVWVNIVSDKSGESFSLFKEKISPPLFDVEAGK